MLTSVMRALIRAFRQGERRDQDTDQAAVINGEIAMTGECRTSTGAAQCRD